MKKEVMCMIGGALATIGVKLFGGWTPTLGVILILMGIDFAAGFIVAAVFKQSPKSKTGAADSMSMFKGLCKKFGMLFVIAASHQIDIALGVDYIMVATIYGFIANETLSIVENAGLMGIVKSEILVNAIEVLKNKANKAN